MRKLDYVSRFYVGKEVDRGVYARYGSERKFLPPLRIQHYCKENGMAWLPLIWRLMMDDQGEITLPQIINNDAYKMSTYIYSMVDHNELIRKKERIREDERDYYEKSFWLHRLLRRDGTVNTTVNLNDREYKIRSLTEEEILQTKRPSFWMIGSLYVVPTTLRNGSKQIGYCRSTIIQINSILHTYGFVKKKRGRYVFKNQEKTLKFLSSFENWKKQIVSRLDAFFEVMDGIPITEVSAKYNIPPVTLEGWKNKEYKPYHLPEEVFHRLGLDSRTLSKAKEYGLIGIPEEAEEEF